MLTLNDGRSELWQWDTGRKLTVDADCSQVHFSNKIFGRSIDVDVVYGVAIIPDILLQTDKDLNVWAFVGTAENGYTKISKTFKVNRRNKPADYVFTPPDQTSLEEIKEKIEYLESIQNPDAIKNAVDDYLANNPIMVKETDPTVPEWAKQPTPPDVKIPDKLPNPHSITFTGAVDASYDGSNPVEIKIPDSGGNVALTADQISALDGMFKIASFTADPTNAYKAFKTAFGIADEEEPDEPVVPDEPEVIMTGISAVYSGGDVPVGTALTDLTGIVVTAMYSDGTSETVTGYTLSGEIAEGSNTVTVSYGGKTTNFTVTGVAESDGDETDIHDGYISDGLEFRLDGIRNTNGERNTTDFNVWEDVSGNGYAVQAPSTAGGQILDSCYYTTSRCQRMIASGNSVLAKLANYTFEVVWKGGKNTSYGANGNIVRYGNGGSKWLIASNGQAVYNSTKYGTAVTYDEYIKHWTVTYDGTNLVLYHEGAQDMSMAATMDITAESEIEFFGDSEWAQVNVGYFYAARIYTRALSADEVKANYDNDIARFGTIPVEVA